MANISHIKVIGRGPVVNFDQEIYPLTLIYSHNEKGKTSIVEAVIQSIFKKSVINENIREDDFHQGTVEVTVNGLGSKEKYFSPGTKKKIDHYFNRQNFALPPKFIKLLYVRAAEVDLAKQNQGIDWEIIKSILSNEDVIDSIMDRIPKEVKKEYEDIHGDRITGEMRTKTMRRLRDELYPGVDEIKQIRKRVDSLSLGEIRNLKNQIKELEENREKIDLAKRFKAYKLDKEFKTIEQQIYDADKIEDIKKDLWEYRKLSKDIQEINKQINELEEKTKNYSKLEALRERYIAAASKTLIPGKIMNLIMAVGFLGVFLGVIFGYKIISIFSLVLGAVFWFLSGFSSKDKFMADEIEKEYKNIYNENLTIASIDSRIKNAQYERERLSGLRKELSNKKSGYFQKQEKIKSYFSELNIETEQNDWESRIGEIEKENEQKKKTREKISAELENLDVNPDEYVLEDPGIEFSFKTKDQINKNMEDLKQRLEQVKSEADREKSSLEGSLLVSGKGYGWGELLDLLNKKEQEIIDEIRNITDSFIAGEAVKKVLDNIKQKQEENIINRLNNKRVSEYLNQFTTRYTGINYQDGKIIVQQKGERPYNINNLSTGAAEQVLMALRCGLSMELAKDKPLFLILDDAFQYSDWHRRKLIIDKMIDIVKSGWQVIYFTMDDNIRKIFNNKAKKLKGNKFKEIVI